MKLSSVNKILIGLLFVFSVVLIPTSVVKADTFQAYNPNNPSDWGITVEVGLAFSDTGYSTSDPTGKDKYVTAWGNFACDYDCWGTFLLARINGLTGDTPLTEGDSPTYYTGGKTLNYYPYGGNTLTAPIFYNPGWNTVAFSGQIGSGGMEPRLIDYVMFFNYVPEVIAPTVTVTASPMTVGYGGGSTISWTSTGAISCSESGGRGGTGTTGIPFYVYPLLNSTTFTVECSTDLAAYCSGTYKDFTTKVNYEGVSREEGGNNSSYWDTRYFYFNIGDGGCMECADDGEIGYKVDPTLLNWYKHTCVQNKTLGICFGVRMSDNRTYIRSGYATKSCSDLSQSSCSSMTGCTWKP